MLRNIRPLLICAAVSATLIACQKDEFAGAASASAPKGAASSASAAAAPTTDAPAAAAAAAPATSGSVALPDGHPPLDSAPQRAAPLAGSTGSADAAGAGPLRWGTPQGWTFAKPASGSMRLGEYIVAGAAGQQPAVMSIFYFGPQGGGGVDANIDRWVGQFTTPEGKPITDAKRDIKTINGMKIHTVDVAGTFNGGMGGGGPQNDQRVLGAIVESPQGLFFFKLVGHKDVMSANEAKFGEFLQSLKAI